MLHLLAGSMLGAYYMSRLVARCGFCCAHDGNIRSRGLFKDLVVTLLLDDKVIKGAQNYW
jgi:hypothetical protein